LGEVDLVGSLAGLADVLDDLQAGEALAASVDEFLVDGAGVDADALLEDGVVLVAFWAFAAVAVDGDVAGEAVAVEGVGVEDFIVAAAVALGFVAVLYFYSGFAMRAVGVGLVGGGGGVVIVRVSAGHADNSQQ
jgi:hypothetical protein